MLILHFFYFFFLPKPTMKFQRRTGVVPSLAVPSLHCSCSELSSSVNCNLMTPVCTYILIPACSRNALKMWNNDNKPRLHSGIGCRIRVWWKFSSQQWKAAVLTGFHVPAAFCCLCLSPIQALSSRWEEMDCVNGESSEAQKLTEHPELVSWVAV